MGEGVAKEYPVLIELLDKAFLPNDWRMDVKKCFAVGWAKGDLASERAYVRIDRISCVTKDGRALVAQGENFAAVYGEDGKVGLIGRVVAKEGTLLARALIAGFLQGVGQILQQSATIVNVSPATGTTTTTIKPSQAVQYSLFGGASKAAEILAKEYERLIKLTFPVIEINAGRKVDVVFFAPPEFKEVCLRCENSTSQ
jgi:conjugal transfer pilus assembly protein TraB